VVLVKTYKQLITVPLNTVRMFYFILVQPNYTLCCVRCRLLYFE